MQVICLFNSVTHSNIGLENFAYLKNDHVDKHVIALKQSQQEAENIISAIYPHANFVVHGLKDSHVSNNFLKSFKKLNRLIKVIKPEVVHAHHTLAASLGAMSCLFKNIFFIVTAHNDFSHYNTVQKFSYSFSYILSDIVVSNSWNTSSSLPFFVPERKKHVIYNGVNFDKLDEVIASTPKTKDLVNIGTLCRMVPQKDLTTFIYAFSKLNRLIDDKNIKLTLVGDGPERDKLTRLVNEYGLEDRVRFTGNLSRADAYAELAKMDIFVVSSRWEGFCNAMVEAAGAGKPVVASNIQPLPEVIGEDNASFFEAGDSQGLADQLYKLLKDPEKRQALGQKAKDFVRSRYSLERSAGEHEKLYLNLAQKRRQ